MAKLVFPPQDLYGNQRTPWALNCKDGCGLVYIDEAEYIRQLSHADDLWCCPRCSGVAWWDDDNYAEYDH